MIEVDPNQYVENFKNSFLDEFTFHVVKISFESMLILLEYSQILKCFEFESIY
jgi:hypothetical protein